MRVLTLIVAAHKTAMAKASEVERLLAAGVTPTEVAASSASVGAVFIAP